MFFPQRLVYKISGPQDVLELSCLPRQMEICGSDSAINAIKYAQEMVVFLDKENPAKILDHQELGPILKPHKDFLFVTKKPDNKPELRTDPLALPIHGKMGSVKILHLTLGATTEGNPKDGNNFEVPRAWRSIAGKLGSIVGNVRDAGSNTLGIFVDENLKGKNGSHAFKALGRGLGNVTYNEDLYKSDKQEVLEDGAPKAKTAEKGTDQPVECIQREIRKAVKSVMLFTDSSKHKKFDLIETTINFGNGDNVSRMTALTRFLAECPHNLLNCKTFVKVLMQLTKSVKENLGDNIDIEIYGPEAAENDGIPLTDGLHGMNGLKAVHKGSVHELGPFMVRVKYRNAKDKNAPVNLLVAKSVMQDNGGHCAKGGAAVQMQADMTGGAAAAAILANLGEDKPNVNLDLVFGIVSNTTDAEAFEVNDVITLSSGVTAEILNTDAEGRIVLADTGGKALQLHRKENVKTGTVTTVSTLTGHAIVVGGNRTVIIGENRNRLRKLEDAGNVNGEPLQSLQFDPIDAKAIEGKYADIKNVAKLPIGPVNARGCLTAAEFIAKGMGLSDKKRKDDFVQFDIAPALENYKGGAPDDISKWPATYGEYIKTLYDHVTAASK